MTDDLERRLREACDRTGKPSGAHMIDSQRMIARHMAAQLDDEDAQCIAQVADCMAHCIENEALLFECLRTEALQAADEIARLRAENEAFRKERETLAQNRRVNEAIQTTLEKGELYISSDGWLARTALQEGSRHER